MTELTVDAKVERLDEVLTFVDRELEAHDCSPRAQMQIDVAVEELFVNIASYAYPSGNGQAIVRVAVDGEPPVAQITLIDSGTPYDPLAKEDPDVTLSVEERPIGGLGIYMVKKSMDAVEYEYKDGQNVLTIRRSLA